MNERTVVNSKAAHFSSVNVALEAGLLQPAARQPMPPIICGVGIVVCMVVALSIACTCACRDRLRRWLDNGST